MGCRAAKYQRIPSGYQEPLHAKGRKVEVTGVHNADWEDAGKCHGGDQAEVEGIVRTRCGSMGQEGYVHCAREPYRCHG
jgi:hypothetical protein